MGKISQRLAGALSVSVELWPPRTEGAAERLESALASLEKAIRPTFCSITYGAGGSTRERTHELVVRLENEGGLLPMAHLVCAAHTRAELTEILIRYREAGVENILALKGDPPLGAAGELPPGELVHAVELVELARSVGDFSVAVAAHPEGHPDSPTLESDRDFLARKLEKADFAITQFFFEKGDYLRLVDDLSRRGVDKPVLAGIQPITSVRSLGRMVAMSGGSIPPLLAARVEKAADRPDEVQRIGVEVASRLAAELLDEGVPGLHFYTMNLAASTIAVCDNLGLAARTGLSRR